MGNITIADGPMNAELALAQCNRFEKEILNILFEYRPVMTNRMKLEAALRVAELLKPRVGIQAITPTLVITPEEKDNNAKIF